MRLWTREGSSNKFTHSINSAGAGFINSLAWIPPSPEHSNGGSNMHNFGQWVMSLAKNHLGLVISGGHETIIEVREPLGVAKPDADYIMLGHSPNVCALDVYGNIIVSGSWDWYGPLRYFHSACAVLIDVSHIVRQESGRRAIGRRFIS